MAAYRLPTIRYHVLRRPSGFASNVREILPGNFNPNKKYPVLFAPYGGPGSQRVSKSCITMAWRHYISSDPELEFIIVTVDGRGTGYQGRKFRSTVAKQLGKLEDEDQVWAGKQWQAKLCRYEPYGDFGVEYWLQRWSSIVGVFSLGLITAPVTGKYQPPPTPYTTKKTGVCASPCTPNAT